MFERALERDANGACVLAGTCCLLSDADLNLSGYRLGHTCSYNVVASTTAGE